MRIEDVRIDHAAGEATMQTATTRTSMRARVGTLLAVGAVAATLVAAGPAAAQPKGGGTTKGCPVENADGTTTTVPAGTQIGLFHCGSDGEWHFGWLTTDLVTQPTTTTGGTVGTIGTLGTMPTSMSAMR
jgi:hypothetical protein